MWGTCANGTEGLGCGYPETFRNCADIRIVSSSSGLPPQFVNTLSHAALSREYSMKAGPMLSYPMVVKYVFILFFYRLGTLRMQTFLETAMKEQNSIEI